MFIRGTFLTGGHVILVHNFLLMFISCFDYIIFKNYYIIALCCTMLHYLFNILLSMIHPVQQSCLEYLSMHWLLLFSSNIQ